MRMVSSRWCGPGNGAVQENGAGPGTGAVQGNGRATAAVARKAPDSCTQESGHGRPADRRRGQASCVTRYWSYRRDGMFNILSKFQITASVSNLPASGIYKSPNIISDIFVSLARRSRRVVTYLCAFSLIGDKNPFFARARQKFSRG